MNLRNWPFASLLLFGLLSVVLIPLVSCDLPAQEEGMRALGGEWLYVEDRTKGRTIEQQGPPMSIKFGLRVEKDAIVMERARREERITLDGSAVEKTNSNGSITRYSGNWKDGILKYNLETVRLSDKKRVLVIEREFRVTPDGLQVSVTVNKGSSSVAIYRHPKDIALPMPAKAKIAEMEWLAKVWIGKNDTSSTEERWSPPLGGGMLGVSRTVSRGKMVAFEYLRIVERDGGLVYVAQPGGRPPTEFVLTRLEKNHAVFDNPRHNYPQRIVYQLSAEGRLSASIGFINGGRPKRFDFTRDGK